MSKPSSYTCSPTPAPRVSSTTHGSRQCWPRSAISSPDLRVLIQVADESGNDLLPGAVDYESIVTTPAPGAQRAGRLIPSPPPGCPPSGEDLYLLYTGGTTGMPKGVMWRQHDIFVSSMGGPLRQRDRLPVDRRHRRRGARSGRQHRLDAAGPIDPRRRPVGPVQHHDDGRADHHARYRRHTAPRRGAAPGRSREGFQPPRRRRCHGTPAHRRDRARRLRPLVTVHGQQRWRQRFPRRARTVPCRNPGRSHPQRLGVIGGRPANDRRSRRGRRPTFAPQSDTAVLADDLDRVLAPGEGEGWLGRSGLVPWATSGTRQRPRAPSPPSTASAGRCPATALSSSTKATSRSSAAVPR